MTDQLDAYSARLYRLAVAIDASDPDRAGDLDLITLEGYVEDALCELPSSADDPTIIRTAWELMCFDDPTLA